MPRSQLEDQRLPHESVVVMFIVGTTLRDGAYCSFNEAELYELNVENGR